MAQRLCNGLPRNDLGFDSRWGRCTNRASRPMGAPSLNDLAVDGTLNITNQPNINNWRFLAKMGIRNVLSHLSQYAESSNILFGVDASRTLRVYSDWTSNRWRC